MKRDDILEHIQKTWPNDPSGEIAQRLASYIFTLREQESSCLSYVDLLEIVELKEITNDFQSALTILLAGQHPLLKAYGIFVDENGDEFPVRDQEFSDLMNDGLLIHPNTGEEVKNAQRKVAPVFQLVEEQVEVK